MTSRLKIPYTMRTRLETEPEPDEEPDEEVAPARSAPDAMVPSVPPPGREFEYRTELVSSAQVLDGSTLAGQLTRASADGWDLVDIIPAGDRHAVLLRRVKQPERRSRPVGFAPPLS